MYLINKTNKQHQAIPEAQISDFGFKNWSILDVSNIEVLTDDIGIEYLNFPEKKYISELTKIRKEGNYDVVQIVEMDEAGKSIVDEEETLQKEIDSFMGYPFKVKVRSKLLVSLFSELALSLMQFDSYKKTHRIVKESGKLYDEMCLEFLKKSDGFNYNPETKLFSLPSLHVELSVNPSVTIGVSEIDEEEVITKV